LLDCGCRDAFRKKQAFGGAHKLIAAGFGWFGSGAMFGWGGHGLVHTTDSLTVAVRLRTLAVHRATANKVPTPPRSAAGTAPNSAAVAPDSNSPSSLDALMNAPWTALTRPRIASGVETCTSVPQYVARIQC
jgi:hypothetical protein